MTLALSHSHQLKEVAERQATGSGKGDPESWRVEIIKSEIGQMENLITTRAYNKAEDKVIFMTYYNNVLELTNYPKED
ncbi:hypothetical protein H70357_26405 [Paenibacillus sp. FSL H7-0357]|nr:hypothetical protein H70357_26405 [Paenibacillus sp. FSL H7-0357]